MKPHNLDVSLSETGDDWGLDLDPEVLQEVCYKAKMEFAKRKEKERSEMQEGTSKQRRYSDQDVKTPAQTTTTTTTTVGIASSSRTPGAAGHERRVVRVPAQLRSPYIDLQNTDPLYCSKEVCDMYDVVCQHSTQTTRSKGKLTDNRQPIINYDEFFISRNELANSMAPEKKMDNLVAEIAIISLMGPEIRPKKRIMPLQIATYFQNNCFIRSDIDKHFENNTQRLNRCESILDKGNPKDTGHYWVLVLNIREKHLEVLDSTRTMKDKAFLATALKIIDGIKAN
uniref:Predicted protein n=1 Tax=Hordeum vulgare subsp. vulgare TaxID=112509 RepID=F2DWV5_HORVV|nr:predicted protein [Hordeum vulgare subsp. vulgare]